jgi:hypothetical protein
MTRARILLATLLLLSSCNGDQANAPPLSMSDASTLYVSKFGDTMTGVLYLPANGLKVGTSQLAVSGGNVGIGTTSPAYSLEVNGEIRASGTISTPGSLMVGNRSVNGAMVGFGDWDDYIAGDGISKYIIIGTNNVERMRIDSNGNIGIGEPNPGFTLDVNGSIAAVGALQAHSDRRLKKDIRNVSNALEKLQEIHGVYFDWRKDEFPRIRFEGGRQMGVIAQDVEKVFPEAVSINKEGILSVAYTMLIAPLIEAARELHADGKRRDEEIGFHAKRISLLQERTETVETENARLKARLDRLEAGLAACALGSVQE